ncbi:unnamed protein product [Staurois parvus]|nr:unnamed protein product [Staurois parvus]
MPSGSGPELPSI